MVCRHDQKAGFRVLFEGRQAGQSQRRRGISAYRLEQDASGCQAGGVQLLGDQEAVLVVADHQRGGAAIDAFQTPRGFLQQGIVLGVQLQELLRVMLARHGPEARA